MIEARPLERLEPPARETAPRARPAHTERRAPRVPAAITATVTALPPHRLDQEAVKRQMGALLPAASERALALFDNVLVDRRYSVLPLGDLAARRSLSDTIGIYREHALALGRKVTAACLDRAGLRATDVDLLITVSCTGFMIPSLDAYLVNALGFRPDVRRLPITELGCLGGAAALARAHDFVQGHPNANVLVVSVELPTLSFQRDDASLANLVSTAIFGDGAAAAIVTGREVPGPAILDTRAHLFPTSEQALGFELRDTGFHVLLAKELPAMVRSEIERLVAELLGRWKLGRADLSFFLLHPGGRKILAAVEEALAIDRADTQTAWDVMRECGNLSSATVFFILERHLARPTLTPAGAHGLLAGFGPGFSTELLLLRWR